MITVSNIVGKRPRFRKKAVETTYDYMVGLIVRNVVLELQRSCSPSEARRDARHRAFCIRHGRLGNARA